MVAACVAAVPDCVDDAFNLVRGEVLTLIVAAPRVPIAAPVARAAVFGFNAGLSFCLEFGMPGVAKPLIEQPLAESIFDKRRHFFES
jgi:hypothetical protein